MRIFVNTPQNPATRIAVTLVRSPSAVLRPLQAPDSAPDTSLSQTRYEPVTNPIRGLEVHVPSE